MNKNSYLRKRVLNIKSQIIEWVKQGRVMADANGQTYYLANADGTHCNILPSHIGKLISNNLKTGAFNQAQTGSAFNTLHCDGILVSEALLSSAPITPKWVDAVKVSMEPLF